MIIIKELGSFKVKDFDGKIYNSSGDLVVGYDTLSPATFNGIVLDRFTIELTGHTISKGEVVYIKGENDIEEDFTISGVGTANIEVGSVLDLTVGSSVEVREEESVITLTAIEEGQYYLSTNEIIIVANTFANLFINKSQIKVRYKNLDDEVDIELLNNEAKESVIADFSFNPYFYKTLDLGQLTELQKRKIQVILTYEDDSTKAIDDYNKLLKSVTSYLNTIVDNTPNKDVTKDDLLADSGVSIYWGS